MDAAVIWFNKVVQNYNSMKDGKDKDQLTESIKLMHAEMELFNDNIPQALALLRFVQPSCLRQQVCHSMIYAKIMLKTGQTDEARQALEFVVQNGNTLSYVPMAKQMLETL
jgi:outer membrane PBP1 activator LpoA protein